MESEEVENDPFQSLDCNLFEEREAAARPRTVRRNWGIPTFEDQIDRGILSFTLSKLQDPSRFITIALEHRKHSTGSDLWDSALVLAHNLEALVPSLEGKTILELGSGTGAVGLYCSRCLGAKHVVLTDLPENLELLERNRIANGISETLVSMAPLDWMSEDFPDAVLSGIDLIVGSDLFLPFAPFLLDPLAKVIARLLALNSSSKAILVYEERFDCSDFERFAEMHGLLIKSVDNSLLHTKYQDPGRIHVIELTLHGQDPPHV